MVSPPPALRSLGVALAACLLLGAAPAKKAPPARRAKAAAPEAPAALAPTPAASLKPAELRTPLERLKVFTDGRGHYLAFEPFGEEIWTDVFYGDGRTFIRQRIVGSGGDAEAGTFDVVFWEPRAPSPSGRQVVLQGSKAELRCREMAIPLKAMPAPEALALLKKASFFAPTWPWRPWALACDEDFNYYFVDRQREPETSLNFRVFVGQQGQVKQQPLVRAASNSTGELLETKAGDFQLQGSKASWKTAKGKVELTVMPVDENAALIYGELGAYAGQRLGTPCDDL